MGANLHKNKKIDGNGAKLDAHIKHEANDDQHHHHSKSKKSDTQRKHKNHTEKSDSEKKKHKSKSGSEEGNGAKTGDTSLSGSYPLAKHIANCPEKVYKMDQHHHKEKSNKDDVHDKGAKIGLANHHKKSRFECRDTPKFETIRSNIEDAIVKAKSGSGADKEVYFPGGGFIKALTPLKHYDQQKDNDKAHKSNIADHKEKSHKSNLTENKEKDKHHKSNMGDPKEKSNSNHNRDNKAPNKDHSPKDKKNGSKESSNSNKSSGGKEKK